LGFGIPRYPAGGNFIRFCDVLVMYAFFSAQKSNSMWPGILIFVAALAQSFVWAVLPFKFALTLYPAIQEMHNASVACNEGLLCESNQDGSAESCLQRAMPHITAAGITAGRSSEVYGIAMPVK
jgi:hypothetical protein